MTVDRPTVEKRAPGVLAVRYEWRDQLSEEMQGALLDQALATSDRGPVALVFVLADRIRDIPPNVRVFWRTITADHRYRVAAVAVVTASWAVEVSAKGFGVTNALSGAAVRVQTFVDEHEAVAWAAEVVRPVGVVTPA